MESANESESSQAQFFQEQLQRPSEEQLSKVGAELRNGVWTFSDGSFGKFFGPEGHFMACDEHGTFD